ncbi:lysophospholipid acyltransferase family protein [Gilvimarinus xylanilyticus]|uniref:Lysophospholipid acyltransferase family protein n=1 Tax=Gilvimarinus xylanilyticus TaxID=2944139 RepID=A0A9X2I6T3_9GAMM|nr:lysophospholipid acyltransferase family protein [Gilvimarinus xylanilyticus]MCP8900517.1 lysophospholipid acyltransferase family protein [Gilvimarinus xylanilyticus]
MKQRLILVLVKGLGCLPLWLARMLGSFVGWLMWISNSRARRTTQTNLRLCLPDMPDAERKALARASVIESGIAGAEIPVVWRRSDTWLRTKVQDYEGVELLRRSLEQGKGVMLLTPHLGNWEVLPCILALHARITVLYQPSDDAALDEYICCARRRAHVDLAPTNRRGVTSLIKALRRGEMVGILPDQVPDPGNGAAEAPFFGEAAQTMTLVHSLRRSTDCEVLICSTLRTPGGFKVVIAPCDSDIYAADPALAAAGVNRSVEQEVRKAPKQYHWEYKRFKGRSMGEPY